MSYDAQCVECRDSLKIALEEVRTLNGVIDDLEMQIADLLSGGDTDGDD